jgi:hypothetical protein
MIGRSSGYGSAMADEEEKTSDNEEREKDNEEREKEYEEAKQQIKELEEEGPPDDLEDWPDGKAKYETFGGAEGDHGYHEGPEEKLGPSSLRHHEDGNVTVEGEEVDDPDEYKGEPIPGGPTDPDTPNLRADKADADDDDSEAEGSEQRAESEGSDEDDHSEDEDSEDED